jgi:hypothetical protein
MADAWAAFDEYVAWYSWANTNLVRDAVVCHTAAAAATHVLAAGGGRDAAAAAARTAAADEAAVGRTRADYDHRHRHVEWFIWAQANLGLPSARCHEAAEAAVQSIADGGSVRSATDAATRLLLPRGLVPNATQPETSTAGSRPSVVGPTVGSAAVADREAPPADLSSPMPPAAQRIRRGLYQQAGFALLRASAGLLVILLFVHGPSRQADIAAGVVIGAALAAASIVLGRLVRQRRRSTRMAIVGLEAVVGVLYGVLMVPALAGLLAGGPLGAVTFDVFGLLIAGNLLRNALRRDVTAWFEAG